MASHITENGSGYAVNFVPPPDFRPKQVPPIANASPSPPRWLKYQVYTDPAVFTSIDEHAVKVSRQNYENYNALIYNLVYSKSFSALERLRLIYRWLTARNLQTITFSQIDVNLHPGSPEDVLVGFKHRRSTYSKIFETMCLSAGIPCALVTGVAKGIEYRPGFRVAQYRTGAPIEKEDQYNHSWNAVFIDNSWQLVDVQWGTRFLQTSADVASRRDENLIYEYDDFYFMPDPSHLIYSHFPDDERWQLMPNPVPFDVFQALPLAKSHFFLAELQFWSHNTGVVSARNGRIKLSIGYWKPVSFTFKMWDADTMSQETPDQGIPLHRYALQETGDGIVNYYIKAPYAGSFYFSIFVQRLDEMEPGKPAVYNAACEYKIVSDRAATSQYGGPVLPYPEIDSNYGYGSSLYYYQYGLVPSFKAGVIQAALPNNDFELHFAKTKQPRVFFRLRPLDDTTGQNEIPVDIRDTNQLARVVGHLPVKGEYVLEVYANDPVTDGNQYTHVGQYMIVSGAVDLPEFKSGPPQSTPAGFARYPDTYDLQSSKPYSKLVYHPSAAASTLPTRPKPAVQPNHKLDANNQSVGNVAFTTTANNRSTVTVHATPYTPGDTSSGPKVQNQFSVGRADDFPAPPSDWDKDETFASAPLRNQQNARNVAPGQSPPVAPKPFRAVPTSGPLKSSSPGLDRKFGNQDIPMPPPKADQPPKETQKLFPSSPINVTFDKDAVAATSSSSTLHANPTPFSTSSVSEGKAQQYAPIGAPAPFYASQPKQPSPLPVKEMSPPKLSEASQVPSPPKQQYSPVPVKEMSPPKPSEAPQVPSPPKQQPVPPAQSPPLPKQSSPVLADEQSSEGSSLKKKQSFIYRTDKFAIKANYQRPSNAVAPSAPQDFEVRRTQADFPPPPVPEKNATTSSPAVYVSPNLINDELEQYDEHARVFSNVDRHAFEVARVQHSTFRDLVWDLIYSHQINDDLEKARALFLWLCTKDLSTMKFQNAAHGSPEEALTGLKSGSTTYASVFEMLCSFAGLHCVTISGFAKGVDYQPGMHFEGKEALHSWNGVLIDGQWRLVDTHWAARRMVGRRSVDNLRYELDEFFFLTSPRQLIYTHFPHDPSWQLLETRLTLQEFENLPPVKSLFFKLGLKFVADAGQAVLLAPHGDRSVQLQFNKAEAASIDFNYALTKEDNRDEIETGDGAKVKLNRFVLHEIIPGHTASFTLRLPMAGNYKFVVFATPKSTDAQANIDRTDRAYSAVCEWKVSAWRPATNPVPFPSCSAQRWGPPLTALAESRGVTGMPTEAKIYTNSSGIAEITLKKVRPEVAIIFAGKVRAHRGYDDSTLDTSLLHRIIDGDKAVFTISAPGRGEFGLDIFTTRQEEEKGNEKGGQRTLFHLCQYLIVCEEPSVSGLRFPALPTGYLGPQRSFTELGLGVLTHPDPFIVLQKADSLLDIQFSHPKGASIRAVASLLRLPSLNPGAQSEDFSDWVLHQSPLSGDRMAFLCRFPKSGTYKLQVYAQSTESVNLADSIPGVFNYLIDVGRNQVKLENILPFPKQYSQWHEGGLLFEPLDGTLREEVLPAGPNRLLVRIAIPRARKVAAVVADTWTHLVAGPDGIWEGVIVLDKVWPNPDARRLAVSANFLADSPNAYATLLEYKLVK